MQTYSKHGKLITGPLPIDHTLFYWLLPATRLSLAYCIRDAKLQKECDIHCVTWPSTWMILWLQEPGSPIIAQYRPTRCGTAGTVGLPGWSMAAYIPADSLRQALGRMGAYSISVSLVLGNSNGILLKEVCTSA